jgi:hypothetical protein
MEAATRSETLVSYHNTTQHNTTQHNTTQRLNTQDLDSKVVNCSELTDLYEASYCPILLNSLIPKCY